MAGMSVLSGGARSDLFCSHIRRLHLPHTPAHPQPSPTLIVTPHALQHPLFLSAHKLRQSPLVPSAPAHLPPEHRELSPHPSPQGDLCVAKLFPPRPREPGKASASDPGHSSSASSRVVRCEASRNLKWSIANTGVISPIYKLSLPSPDSPIFPSSKYQSLILMLPSGACSILPTLATTSPQAITGKTPEEKAVWQTLGEGNEDCVEWVVLCAALNLLDDEIIKAAEKNPPPPSNPNPAPNGPSSTRFSS
ncbi:hypothetical protein CPB84DRAFT_1846487 [Gymnopilus junonius]|uniref:Uncharacterized protein n=1 Tax=Gymnopilus junonius TaxID=109634 RepID=A0A9P5NPF7_GYMJU|nr:hypothetical protein CPB84DRAFT_1846487 [Gymnopilus junonius]